MTTALFFDIETTGLNMQTERIVEVAVMTAEGEVFSELVHPGKPIPLEASQIHGITDADVEHAQRWEEVGRRFWEFCQKKAPFVLVAHNGISFDIPFLTAECARTHIPMPSFRAIDTLMWARRYRPDLRSHALQALREAYQIPANQAHRALDGVKVLAKIFAEMTGDLTVERVMRLLEQQERTMPFGKYKGKAFEEIPRHYLVWLKESGALDKPENAKLAESIQSVLK